MQASGASCPIEWLDINDDPQALAARGVSIDDVRLKLHVEDEAGNLHVGAAAVAALLRETPRQRWLGRLTSAPILSTMARWAYDAFAAALYRWNRSKGRW
jgi:predicted DCC family thiol-disulfide oxidoreductase YuxK